MIKKSVEIKANCNYPLGNLRTKFLLCETILLLTSNICNPRDPKFSRENI